MTPVRGQVFRNTDPTPHSRPTPPIEALRRGIGVGVKGVTGSDAIVAQ